MEPTYPLIKLIKYYSRNFSGQNKTFPVGIPHPF